MLYATNRDFLTSGSCNGKKLFVILNKVQTTPGTVEYTVKQLYRFYCSGAPQATEGTDTILVTIANDTVVNNANNLLDGVLTVANDGWLSTSLVFDTVQGLKHLNVDVSGFEFACDYDALQNIGLTYYRRSEGGMEINEHMLTYARLQHYGIYGQYNQLILSTPSGYQIAQAVEYDFINKILKLKNEANDYDALRLYDVSGRCVLNVQSNVKSVLLNHLIPGVYFYQLVGKESASGKILVR
ncbi:MAG TPA: T9SS type A sorting domain-containing protein [Chitinophagales bacterium]|nr:T9SS type A sorting domain-containing protein [Chitinophagales bacterium]